MRVFPDTDVIVSAVTTRGLCADVLRTVLSEHELVSSTLVLHEVRRILRTKFSVPERLVSEYLELIKEAALLAEGKGTHRIQLKDKDDVEIVVAAVAAESDVHVTGDREIQGLKSIQGVRVLSPRAFWKELTAKALWPTNHACISALGGQKLRHIEMFQGGRQVRPRPNARRE